MASAEPLYGKLGASFRTGGKDCCVGELRETGRPEPRCPVTRSARQCTHFGRPGPTPQVLRLALPTVQRGSQSRSGFTVAPALTRPSRTAATILSEPGLSP